MTLFFIGLGLGSLDDVTLKGHKILESVENIFLESYTSVQEGLSVNALKKRYPLADVHVATRETVEGDGNAILNATSSGDVAFLVVGDPFGATTHADLFLRAHKVGIVVKVIHNASIMNAVGSCGLQLYRFGQTVSIPYFDGSWRPSSFVQCILQNYKANLHTLMLLDIKVREQTVENIVKSNNVFEPARFMSIENALGQLTELDLFSQIAPEALFVGLARVGHETQKIAVGSAAALKKVDFGKPLHSLILVAPQLDEIEKEFLALYTVF